MGALFNIGVKLIGYGLCYRVSVRVCVTSCPASALASVVPAGVWGGRRGSSVKGIRDANIPVRAGCSPGLQMSYTDLVYTECVRIHLPLLDTLVNTLLLWRAGRGTFHNGPLRRLKWESASLSETVVVSAHTGQYLHLNATLLSVRDTKQTDRLQSSFGTKEESEQAFYFWKPYSAYCTTTRGQMVRQHKCTSIRKKSPLF